MDLSRLGVDKTNITVNYATVPATVTIKEGSIIEVNGNLYTIEGADYSFQMANATHNYITFTDNPAVAFSSAAARGTYQDDKHGFYQVGNLVRTLQWYIDQTNSLSYIDFSIQSSQGSSISINDDMEIYSEILSVRSYAADDDAGLSIVNTSINNAEYNYNFLVKRPVTLWQFIEDSGLGHDGRLMLISRFNSITYTIYDSGVITTSEINKIHILNPGYYRAYYRAYLAENRVIKLSLCGVFGKNSMTNLDDIIENI
jgi:hypothetical protein